MKPATEPSLVTMAILSAIYHHTKASPFTWITVKRWRRCVHILRNYCQIRVSHISGLSTSLSKKGRHARLLGTRWTQRMSISKLIPITNIIHRPPSSLPYKKCVTWRDQSGTPTSSDRSVPGVHLPLPYVFFFNHLVSRTRTASCQRRGRRRHALSCGTCSRPSNTTIENTDKTQLLPTALCNVYILLHQKAIVK